METCTYKEVWDELNVYEKTGWRQVLSHLPWTKPTDRFPLLGSIVLPYELTAFYQFGIYTGKSVIVALDAIKNAGKKIDITYGFDSFEGLPERTNQERDEIIKKHGKYLWKAGDYSSDELYEVEDSREFLQNMYDKYLDTPVKLIRGWYEDTLNKDTVKKHNLQPAAYVDVDVDTYDSCVEVLDFIFSEGIAVYGTILGFDDWGGTPGWEEMEDGVSQALKEAILKYNLDLEVICRVGDAYPQVQAMFLVK
jgi:hypothetical protein